MPEQIRLYHQVPSPMQGEILHPLNDLKEIHPDVYEKERAKYNKRQGLLEETIPGTDWKWNDALHLSAVHPSELRSALREAGGNPPVFEAFEIDPEAHEMNAKNTVFYFNPIGGEAYTEPFDKAKINGYVNIPEATKQYYREMFEKGEIPFLHHGVPHILHKGPLDTRKMGRVQG